MKNATDRSAAAKRAAATRKRSASANKAAATRKANAAAKKRSEAAVRAAATSVTGHALSPRDSHIISWRVSQFGYGLRRYPAGTKQPENLERPSGGLRV